MDKLDEFHSIAEESQRIYEITARAFINRYPDLNSRSVSVISTVLLNLMIQITESVDKSCRYSFVHGFITSLLDALDGMDDVI